MSSTKNVEIRGSNNPANSAYTDTVADYSSSGAQGDNTIENITCDPSVSVGDIVRMDGSTVIRALANSFTNSKVIGICTSKSDATTCNVQVCGFTSNIFAGLSNTATYFLSDSTPGALTSTAPTATGSYVIRIGKTYNGSSIIIQLERVVKRT